jgi:serine/threonine-protein kinase
LVAGVRARDDVRVPVARPRNGGGVESGTLEAALRAGLDERFDIARELSGGNMARVFVATERALQRQVVLKVLLPEHGEGVSVERFRREIQVAARLAHPNLVPVLTAGEMAGHPFYVMPLVAGASLRDRLTGGPLPLLEARAILRDVADALAYAHDRGIVHRDIKPGNVLLVGARALVTDFGIAKAISDARIGAVGAPLTHTGSSLGTPTYMAPEQAAADPATDHRADVYSFGVMAWEMLVGHPPFHGLAPQALLAAHMSTVPPDVRAARPEVPSAFAELVMQCLAKDPVARPQRMAGGTPTGCGGRVRGRRGEARYTAKAMVAGDRCCGRIGGSCGSAVDAGPRAAGESRAGDRGAMECRGEWHGRFDRAGDRGPDDAGPGAGGRCHRRAGVTNA